MGRTGDGNWLQGKVIKEPLRYDEEKMYEDHEVEMAIHISQDQLNNARLFTSKYEYAKTLNKNISYLEIGVGWGDSANMFINETNAASADLVDFYDNAAGVRHPGGNAPEDSSITHEQHIKNKFSTGYLIELKIATIEESKLWENVYKYFKSDGSLDFNY